MGRHVKVVVLFILKNLPATTTTMCSYQTVGLTYTLDDGDIATDTEPLVCCQRCVTLTQWEPATAAAAAADAVAAASHSQYPKATIVGTMTFSSTRLRPTQ